MNNNNNNNLTSMPYICTTCSTREGRFIEIVDLYTSEDDDELSEDIIFYCLDCFRKLMQI